MLGLLEGKHGALSRWTTFTDRSVESRPKSTSHPPSRQWWIVDFEIAPGALLVVLGPSGSCKTTLSNILGGIEPSTSGSRICTGRTE